MRVPPISPRQKVNGPNSVQLSYGQLQGEFKGVVAVPCPEDSVPDTSPLLHCFLSWEEMNGEASS